MIRLFTGLPGAGKTVHAIAEMEKYNAQGRPCFVANLNGMNMPWAIPLEDPRKWEDLPPNAVLFVDEAQRFWRASRSLDVPPEIAALETHRHLGIDFILTTQQPNYLLKHLRGLVGEHTHHLRRTNGTAQTWTWNAVCDDVDSLSERDRADVGLFVYPKHAFAMYKSTEQDTHKPGIPRKWKFIGGAALMIVALFTFGPGYMKSKTIGTSKIGSDEGASAEPPSQGSANYRAKPVLNTEQYMAKAAPRHQALPWSSQLFDDRKAVANPEIFCISSEAGIDANGHAAKASQHCITEQGTLLLVDPVTARKIARHGGVYNPYRAPVQPQQQAQAMELPALGQAMPPPEQTGDMREPEQQAAYGSMRNTDRPK